MATTLRRRGKTPKKRTPSPSTQAAAVSNRRQEEESLLVRHQRAFNAEAGFFDKLYEPHTLTTLALMLYFVYYSILHGSNSSQVDGLKQGAFLAAIVFLTYGCLQFRDSEMVRPHPVLWRFVHSAGILYLLFLAFLLPFDLPTSRRFVSHIHPMLGKKQPQLLGYAEDCRLFPPDVDSIFSYPIVKMALFDEYMIAHALGYIIKALIVRDWRVLCLLSFGFEVLEVSFQHALPNLNECWWDRLFLDILGANLAGMCLGMWLVKLFKSHPYDWIGNAMSNLTSKKGKARRVLRQFTPYSYDTFNWKMFDSPRRFGAVMILVAAFLTSEVAFFYFKYHLWIGSINPIYLLWMLIRTMLAVHSIREWYAFNSDDDEPSATRQHRRLGQNCWVHIALISFEVLLVRKWNEEAQMLWPPKRIVICWGATSTLVVVWMLLRFFNIRKCGIGVGIGIGDKSEPKSRYLWLLALACLPLVYLFLWDMHRTGAYYPSKPTEKGSLLLFQ